jgi:hypothetical protein
MENVGFNKEFVETAEKEWSDWFMLCCKDKLHRIRVSRIMGT